MQGCQEYSVAGSLQTLYLVILAGFSAGPISTDSKEMMLKSATSSNTQATYMYFLHVLYILYHRKGNEGVKESTFLGTVDITVGHRLLKLGCENKMLNFLVPFSTFGWGIEK